MRIGTIIGFQNPRQWRTDWPSLYEQGLEFAVSADGQRMIAQDGEFVLAPGVFPPIQGAEKVTPNMIPMDNPSEEEAKSLSNEFRQIFFAK